MPEEEIIEKINLIKSKYEGKSTRQEKVEEIEKLDKSVEIVGTIWALIYGIIGTLFLGVGICCFFMWSRIVFGIIIGLFGILIMSFAIPGGNVAMEKQKSRVCEQIKRLSDEILV